jgi:hypothetical protein
MDVGAGDGGFCALLPCELPLLGEEEYWSERELASVAI